jgi:hypothetical protein
VTSTFPETVDSFPRPGPTTNTDDPGYELDLVLGHIVDGLEKVEQQVGGTAATQWGVMEQAVGSYAPVLASGSHNGTYALGTTTLNASLACRVCAINVARDATFDRASMYLATPATDAGSVFMLGVYDPRDGALLQDCGTIDATSAAGQKDLNVNFDLPAGLYLMAIRFATPTTAGTNPAIYGSGEGYGIHYRTMMNTNNHWEAIGFSLPSSTAAWHSNLSGMNLALVPGTAAVGVPRLSLRRSA